MNIKTLIVDSLKSVENLAENNIKINVNTIINNELNNMLSQGIKPRDVFKNTLIQFVL